MTARESELSAAGRSWRGRRARFLPVALPLAIGLCLPACGQEDWVPVPDSPGAFKSSGAVRADRRQYDGAPPVIPHADFGANCQSCHDPRGISVAGIGFAPPSPHEGTVQAAVSTRCRQCHVPVVDHGLFAPNRFEGLPQDLRRGSRLYEGAPPTIPHKVFMRENCGACHVGPGAREEILTTHPERTRCRQCHVPVTTREGTLDYGEIGLENSEGS